MRGGVFTAQKPQEIANVLDSLAALLGVVEKRPSESFEEHGIALVLREPAKQASLQSRHNIET